MGQIITTHLSYNYFMRLLFYERLKDLRLEKELSQEQLAKETGLSQVGISQWEHEKRIPNAIYVVMLAKYFDVTADYILGLTND